MSRHIEINENGLYFVADITEDDDVRLLHLSTAPFTSSLCEEEKRMFRLVELQCVGRNHNDHHGGKHTGTLPGSELRYREHSISENEYGKKLEIKLSDGKLSASYHLQMFTGIPAVRTWTEVKNIADEPQTMEYISSFCLTGFEKDSSKGWEECYDIHIPHNTWFGEAQWKKYSLPELGLYPVNAFSMKRISAHKTGTWSTSEYLPMGYLENRESKAGILWQIENNGSWHWEVSDICGHLYLQLSGPTGHENLWNKTLKPGESFVSAAAAVCFSDRGFSHAVAEMTKYRRIIRRKNRDNELLPIIFNDYMNCLNGDPTTEKLLPLIDAAAEAGCEYFCIDCGWYSSDYWWDSVGEWLPSSARFPNGIEEPIAYIREKGMIPGLWLEIEVMGVNCPLAKKIPDDWFFKKNGMPIIDNGRYQLDFRNPQVVAHADAVIKRLIGDYGVGYIKMDYNCEFGPGTETDADSLGDGLLEHSRAYLAWLDSVFQRYPEIIIENCSSGGMRMNYELLKRCSIQSCSDQTDYKKMAVIAASCASAATMEQCAIWSYPLCGADSEETVFNMVNAILMRVHQSGHLAELGEKQRELVKEGLDCYKRIRTDLLKGLPFWPSGLPAFGDNWISFGVKNEKKAYIAVWNLNGDGVFKLSPEFKLGDMSTIQCIYPSYSQATAVMDAENNTVSFGNMEKGTARLFMLS